MIKPSGIAAKLIEIYQNSFSVILGGRCRFYPSCSEYARLALHKHGLWHGGIKAFFRITKCNPLHPGGVDEP